MMSMWFLPIFFLFLLEQQTVKSANILGVFTTASYSHQIVFQPIWKELSLRGHNVTVITPLPLKDKTLTNLTEIDVSYSRDVAKGARHNTNILSKKRSSYEESKRLSEIYFKVSDLQLKDPRVQNLIHNEDTHFDLILVEYIYPSMFMFKDIFNCPMVGITSLSLLHPGHQLIGNPDNPVVHPSFMLPFSVNSNMKERFTSIFFYFFSFWKYSNLMSEWDEALPNYIGNKKIRPLSEISRDFDLVIVNSNLAVSNARPSVPNLIDISGIHISKPKALPKDIQDFMDEASEGVIYVSFGSTTQITEIPEDKLNEIIKCLSQVPYKILWKFDRDFKDPPPNFLVKNWLPQQDILAHPNIKLFIYQGGIQSTDEALFRKVPLLFIPLLADQKFNADHMTRRGAAIKLELTELTSDNLKEAIGEIIQNPKYRKNIEKLSAIAQDHIVDPLEKAVWWIEYVLRHEGADHLKYSGRDVPFYIYFWLDIIALALSILSLIVFGAIVLLKFLWKNLKRTTTTNKAIKTD